MRPGLQPAASRSNSRSLTCSRASICGMDCGTRLVGMWSPSRLINDLLSNVGGWLLRHGWFATLGQPLPPVLLACLGIGVLARLTLGWRVSHLVNYRQMNYRCTVNYSRREQFTPQHRVMPLTTRPARRPHRGRSEHLHRRARIRSWARRCCASSAACMPRPAAAPNTRCTRIPLISA